MLDARFPQPPAILQLASPHATAHVRLACAYQARHKFGRALSSCQEAQRDGLGSTVVKERLQRVPKE